MDTLLVSMELTPAEAKQENSIESEPPKYPWGLCIDLNEDALKKLGIGTLPEVGANMSIVARAEVVSAATNRYQGDKEPKKFLSLQITDMSVSPVAKDVSGTLYGG